MKIILSFVAICIFTQGAASAYLLQKTRADSASVQGISLALSHARGMCQLIATKDDTIRTFPLKMQWPCAFHVDLNSDIRVEKEGSASYIIVESARRQDSDPRDCQTSLKSVKIQQSNVEVSKNMAQLASCPPFQWDSYVFTELFNRLVW
ncbi:MAG: hypothetical protein QE278_04555 [Limnobacter sp.]|nr:hypothetical protein [Limnobacter sp.]